eukprot:9372632-Karenia_brevis.AAC.1
MCIRDRLSPEEEEGLDENEVASRKFLKDAGPEVTTQILGRVSQIFARSSAAEQPVDAIVGIAKEHRLTAAI